MATSSVPTNPSPATSFWSRVRWWVVAALTLLLVGLGTWMRRTTLVEHLAAWAGLELELGRLDVDWSTRTWVVEDVVWSGPGAPFALSLDHATVRSLTSKDGAWSINRLELGHLLATVEDPVEGTGGPSAGWDELWSETLSALVVDTLSWNSIGVDLLGEHRVDVSIGTLGGVLVGPHGIELGEARIEGATLASPAALDSVTLNPSSFSGRWSPSGWTIESPGLSMPGIAFRGALSWPTSSGEGQASFHWRELRPWAEAWNADAWLDHLSLDDDSTSVTWELDSASWTIHATGPEWFQASATGEGSEWNGAVAVATVPAMAAEIVPASSLLLSATGNRNDVTLTLQGDSSVSVEGRMRLTEGVTEWVQSPHWPMFSSLRVSRWGPWISSEAQALEGSVTWEDSEVTCDVGQSDSSLPWHLTVRGWDDTWRLRSEAGPFLGTGQDSLTFNTVGEVGTSPLGMHWHLTHDGTLLADTLEWRGEVNWRDSAPSWTTSLSGETMKLDASGTGLPNRLPEAMWNLVHRVPTTWPRARLTGWLAPATPWMERLSLPLMPTDTTSFAFDVEGPRAEVHVGVSRLEALGSTWTDVTASGTSSSAEARMDISADQVRDDERTEWSLAMTGARDWQATLHVAPAGTADPVTWALTALPRSNHAPWTWTLREASIPLGGALFQLQDAPSTWEARLEEVPALDWRFQGEPGHVQFATQVSEGQPPVLMVSGDLQPLGPWTSLLPEDLDLDRLTVQGQLEVNVDAPEQSMGLVVAHAQDVSFADISTPDLQARARWRQGALTVDVQADNPDEQAQLEGRLAWEAQSPRVFEATTQWTNLPLDWIQPWVDSSAAQLRGRLSADVALSGPWLAPDIRGRGRLDTVSVDVPSLGTSFGGEGEFVLRPGECVLQNFKVSDVLGRTARVEGALLHDRFEDWNFDVSVVDTPSELLIMDLPPSSDLPVSGTLVGQGAVDVFFWNNQIEIKGDVSAEAPTDFKISLYGEEASGWQDFVSFVTVPTWQEQPALPNDEALGVLLDLNIQAKKEAQITILVDPENDANIVGNAEGDIHLVLEDWDRMTLTGELDIVEGQYDFALGPILRKTFVVTPGGQLKWDGDPYQGVLDLDAVYQTRANVQPLLGSSGSGVQNEDIDVILHLDGPMLRPNIGFDLGAPNAPTLVAEALATAVVDESERTSQAIALLSLQEFLPQQFNTLELGSNGLQEYSIDVVTNQLSQWLSRINDDVDIGIRYDANAAIDPTSVNQDALQLALKASFFQDKLEVEGAVGSRDVTQDALGEAQLQNIRVLYNLNDEKSLQLTGFSESQTSATQSANTTSQGVGIRWHRSFNWTWPWRQSTETSTDAIEADEADEETN